MENLEEMVNSCVLDQSKSNLKPIFAQSDVYQGKETKNKQLILKYLTSLSPSWITSARVIDNISNTLIERVDNSYSDGVFEWSESEIYHYEKYNMPLNYEFILHCVMAFEKGDND